MRLCLAIFVFGVSLFGPFGMHAQAQKIDFEKQVLPILQLRCFECHAKDQDQGDLKLDSAEAIKRGGHSGAAIIGATPEESELYLRITSTSPGYQMPKRRKPLPTAEIALIREWIEQGGQWSVSELKVKSGGQAGLEGTGFDSQTATTFTGRLGEVWNEASKQLTLPSGRYAAYLAIAFLILFGAMWLVPRYETRAQREANQTALNGRGDTEAVRWGARWYRRAGWFLFAGVTCLAAFLWGRVETLQEIQANGISSLETRRPKVFEEVVVSKDNLVQPPYPMHPRRLGGLYYRGNDERSDQLFNGGFYRTATIELFLTDTDGKRLAWGDQVSNQDLFVELTIRRAANATTELFTSRVRESTYLKHFPAAPNEAVQMASRIDFDVVEPLEVWRARIKIAAAEDIEPSVDGMLYLMYGAQSVSGANGESQIGRVHFGIKYALRRNEGEIRTDSELWMGSIYNLNGRVLVPGKDEVLLDRWFDFRPIPEIEGEPNADPELLGLPEHKSLGDNL